MDIALMKTNVLTLAVKLELRNSPFDSLDYHFVTIESTVETFTQEIPNFVIGVKEFSDFNDYFFNLPLAATRPNKPFRTGLVITNLIGLKYIKCSDNVLGEFPFPYTVSIFKIDSLETWVALSGKFNPLNQWVYTRDNGFRGSLDFIRAIQQI